MQCRKIGGEGEQTFVLILDDGEDPIEQLLEFARKRHIKAAHIEGIGALSDVVLGWWDRGARRHRPIPVDGEVEIVSFAGDIVAEDDHPALRAHLVVAGADGKTHGGQLLRACARPRLEIVFTQTPRHLRRRVDPETGLALLDLDSIHL